MFKYSRIIVLIVLSVLTTGCINVNENFKETRNKVFSFLGKASDREIEFGLGSAGLALAGSIIRFGEKDDMPADIMAHLSGIQIGIYNYYDRQKFDSQNFKKFSYQMSEDGWKYIVRVCDDKNASCVFIKEDIRDGIKEMLVVSNENDKLVIAELKGDLESVVATLIRNKNFDLQVAHN